MGFAIVGVGNALKNSAHVGKIEVQLFGQRSILGGKMTSNGFDAGDWIDRVPALLGAGIGAGALPAGVLAAQSARAGERRRSGQPRGSLHGAVAYRKGGKGE